MRATVTDYQNMTTIDSSPEMRKKLNIGDIRSNQAKCLLCGDTPRSKNKHHCCPCKCGKLYVDGGSRYAKRMHGNADDREDMVVLYNKT